MAKEKPLYEDHDIMIEAMPHSPEDHYLNLINPDFGEPRQHIIQRGILREYATTPRNEILSKMSNANEYLIHDANERGLTIDSLEFAICQAYFEEERRREIFMREFKARQDE